MTSFAIHDLTDVPAHPGRRARQRGGGGARGRAGSGWSASAARRAWRSARSPSPARRRAPARRSRSARSSAPRPRPSGIGQTVQAARRAHRDPIERRARGRARPSALPRQDPRRGPPHHRGLPARHRRRIDGLDAFRGQRLRARLPERVRGGLARRRARVTTPDLICVLDTVSGDAIGTETLRYGQRVDRHRAAGAADPAHAQGARARRARAPSATTSTSARCSREAATSASASTSAAPTPTPCCSRTRGVVHAVKTPTTADVTTRHHARAARRCWRRQAPAARSTR